MEKAIFDSHLYAESDQSNPLKMQLTFVFTDYQPNKNNQGIPKSEAANIINSGKNMPIKVNYTAAGVGGHNGAIPVGPIIDIFEKEDKLYGKATLWKGEFPDLAAFLEEQMTAHSHVGFSWELFYKEASEDSGINWLKDCIVRGATIVETPAYEMRTPLLAIAEKNGENNMPDVNEKLVEAQTQLNVKNAELDTVRAELDVAKAGINDLTTQLAELKTKFEEQSAELTTLREFKAQVDEEKAFAEKQNARKSKCAEAGIEVTDDHFTDDSFIMNLDDTAFDQWVTFTKANVTPKEKAQASASITSSITPELPIKSNGVNVKDVAAALRNQK